jgi:uncharacterized membrane protein
MVVASMQSWFYWALLSALFASLTAIFAKIGLDGVDSDFATKVAPVDKLSVVLVALFAVMFLGERPALKDWFGILLVGAGVVVLAFKC